ncbi:MAG: AbrB/MazE/SpoVT family DNA-binding domain-containing protein [Actinomycetota bacterium]|nr:AbrB/MazE/SpoVT family DNA-binding domain-containing protein [Actinomycetota bacterium]
MRITSKGQVTIPQSIRERHGLLPDVEVEFVEVGDAVTIVAKATTDDRGDRVVRGLRGRARPGLTTEQILAMTRA